MDDYNRYVTAVNKIYDYLEKMKAGWNNSDNKNYIDNIDDFKNIVISQAEEFKKPPTVKLEKTSAELEAEQEAALEEAAKKKTEHQFSGNPNAAKSVPEPKKIETVEKIPIQEIPSSMNSSNEVEAL